MAKRVSLYLLLLCCLSSARAEVEFDIDMKVFLPRIYYVGDEVELQLKIRLLEAEMKIRTPELLPVESWIEIRSVYPVVFPADTLTLTILFVTFKAGKQILPPLDLGDFTLEGIEVETQSVLLEGNEKRIKPRRGQLETPGTRLKISLTILTVCLLPLLIFLIIKYSLLTVNRIQQSRLKEVPRHRIRRGLRRLAKQISKIDSRQFYIIMADIIRDYLQHRFTVPALTLTTRELKNFFSAGLQEETLRENVLHCTRILQESDTFKFGGRPSADSEKLHKIEEVLKFINAIEQEQDHVEP